VIVENLSPSTLRHLAAAIERRDPVLVARRQLSAEGVERLADILLRGGRPTIGFFRRHRSERLPRNTLAQLASSSPEMIP
jgi:hypothetical protein